MVKELTEFMDQFYFEVEQVPEEKDEEEEKKEGQPPPEPLPPLTKKHLMYSQIHKMAGSVLMEIPDKSTGGKNVEWKPNFCLE